MPEYPPTPENLDISPRSSRDEDDGGNSTGLDRQRDGRDTFEEGKRYSYLQISVIFARNTK